MHAHGTLNLGGGGLDCALSNLTLPGYQNCGVMANVAQKVSLPRKEIACLA